MLDSIRFVQGAVAKKNLVPALTHFRIQNERILGFNGTLCISSPIAFNIDANPKAVPLIKAITTCRETIQLSLTKTGRLSIRSGPFKALIECLENIPQEMEPIGTYTELPHGILEPLRVLAPFIAEDASRDWARGILLRGQSAFATNNVILVEKWVKYAFPIEANLPKTLIAELLRINIEPVGVQLATNSITFHYAGERWLCSQLYTTQWPDVSSILDEPVVNLLSVPAAFWHALEALTPFVGDSGMVHISPNNVSTAVNLGEATESGATIQIENLPAEGSFNLKYLKQLKKITSSIDFAAYPKPCLFFGDNLRGAIAGLRS